MSCAAASGVYRLMDIMDTIVALVMLYYSPLWSKDAMTVVLFLFFDSINGISNLKARTRCRTDLVSTKNSTNNQRQQQHSVQHIPRHTTLKLAQCRYRLHSPALRRKRSSELYFHFQSNSIAENWTFLSRAVTENFELRLWLFKLTRLWLVIRNNRHAKGICKRPSTSKHV